MPVRTFDSVLSTLRGGPSLTEAMGLAPSDLAVVETDGTFEQADSLKTAYDGAPATGYDVFRHSFDEFVAASRCPGPAAGHRGRQRDLPRAAPSSQSCGGGLYAHRYSTGRRLRQPVRVLRRPAGLRGRRRRADHRAGARPRRSPTPTNCGSRSSDWDRELLRRRQRPPRGRRRLGRGLAGLRTIWTPTTPTAAHLDRVLAHPYLRASLHRSWTDAAVPPGS